jgi:hypothetical protein
MRAMKSVRFAEAILFAEGIQIGDMMARLFA